MSKEQYGPGIAMTDLATNLLGVFICLFMLSFLMMSKKIEDKNNKVESKAEFLITVTWPEDSDNDVDTYVEDPLGNLVFFRAREKGLMHLDRDDVGKSSDRVACTDGKYIEIKENREIITIRGIIPGEYVVNAHLYSRRDGVKPTPVTIKMEKINPAFRMVTQKQVTLMNVGDEKTAFRFTLDNGGDVVAMNDLEKAICHSPGNASNQNPEFYQGQPAEVELGDQYVPPPPLGAARTVPQPPQPPGGQHD